MATGNIISICNRALLAIGSQTQISSLTQASTAANACSTLFTPTFESLARAAYWNCLRAQTTLSLLAAAGGTPENVNGTTLPLPPSPWLYMYQLPSNSLQARFIVPTIVNQNSTGVPIFPVDSSIVGSSYSLGQIPFRVAYSTDVNNNPIQVILTDQTQAQLVYTVNQPNPQIWDSLFQAAMVASLAAFLAPPLSLNMSLMKIQAAMAEQMIQQARIRDGDEGTTSQDHIPDWIQARNSGSVIGNNAWGGGYTDMCWGFI